MFEHIDERNQLGHFCDAYLKATGQSHRVVSKSERPDFICKREIGSRVGVEFTLITRNPESSKWASFMDGEEFMNLVDAVYHIQGEVDRMTKKRRQSDWQHPDSAILVLSTPAQVVLFGLNQ